MTEISRYWQGTVTGDAGPYTTDVFHSIWKTLFSQDDDEGIVKDFDNELVIVGVSGGVQVETGAALVDGTFYKNDATVSVTIPTPITDSRIDRVVLQKDWAQQTVRIARVAGVENASPSAPALTQTSGAIWEIPLAQVLITTAGVITLTDEHEIARMSLIPTSAGLVHIETITSDGTVTAFDFQDIPNTFRHLMIEIQGRFASGSSALNFRPIGTRFNGDAGNNYNVQGVIGGDTTDSAEVAANFDNFSSASWPLPAAAANYAGSSCVFISNYKDTDVYKTALPIFGLSLTGGSTFNDITVVSSSLWENTDAIDRILLFSSGLFAAGSKASLYGIK